MSARVLRHGPSQDYPCPVHTDKFFSRTMLTFTGTLDRMHKEGSIDSRDKIGALIFFLLTLPVKAGNLGNLDKLSLAGSLLRGASTEVCEIGLGTGRVREGGGSCDDTSFFSPV